MLTWTIEHWKCESKVRYKSNFDKKRLVNGLQCIVNERLLDLGLEGDQICKDGNIDKKLGTIVSIRFFVYKYI